MGSELEAKYGLKPINGQKHSSPGDSIRKIEYGQTDLKQRIKSVFSQLAETYSFGALTEFRVLLNLYNMDMEERKGELGDKIFRRLV